MSGPGSEEHGCCCCCKLAVLGTLVLAVYLLFRYFLCRKRKSPIKEDYKNDVVYLYQFPRVRHIPNLSPYCLKLETWLRMADVPYENVACGWLTRSCEGTVPFVECNGQEHPDSSLAIRDLTAIFSKEAMEEHLSSEQRSTARAFEKLAETSLTMTIAQLRFAEHVDVTFDQISKDDFGVFYPIARFIATKILSCLVLKMVKKTGIGKHSRLEILNIAADDLRAISQYLSRKEYFFGSTPTRVDATLFGVLAQIVYAPYDFRHKELIVDELPNLKEYCERMKNRYWPDWEECTTKFTLDSNWKKEKKVQ